MAQKEDTIRKMGTELVSSTDRIPYIISYDLECNDIDFVLAPLPNNMNCNLCRAVAVLWLGCGLCRRSLV
jgi:hypothetical protein